MCTIADICISSLGGKSKAALYMCRCGYSQRSKPTHGYSICSRCMACPQQKRQQQHSSLATALQAIPQPCKSHLPTASCLRVLSIELNSESLQVISLMCTHCCSHLGTASCGILLADSSFSPLTPLVSMSAYQKRLHKFTDSCQNTVKTCFVACCATRVCCCFDHNSRDGCKM